MSRPLSERLRGIAGELVRFVVVGGFCFVLDTALSLVFRFEIGLGPTTSKGLSTIIATGVSYLGNRMWSFSHRVDDDAKHHRDITLYAVINGIGLVITLIPVDISHYVFDQKSKLAFIVSGVLGTGVATIFRFWAYRKYVFAGNKEQAERVALV